MTTLTESQIQIVLAVREEVRTAKASDNPDKLRKIRQLQAVMAECEYALRPGNLAAYL